MSRAQQQQQPGGGGGGGAGAKLKATPRALFSCGIFSTCTHPALSPTATPNNNVALGNGLAGSATPCTEGAASPLAEAAAALPSPPQWHLKTQTPGKAGSNANGAGPSSSSSSSSSSASQSFTQWRLPVHHPPQQASASTPAGAGHALASAEEKFAAGEAVAALRAVEREMEAASSASARAVPAGVIAGVVAAVREPATARLAAKVLLVVLLEEGNREAAVEAGAASAAVEAVAASGPAGSTAERALASLELLCTAAGGAAAVRREALAAPVLARAVEGMAGRGRECAIGVLAAIYGGTGGEEGAASPPPPEVVKAVVGAMQGECSARGRRKGAQLLRALQEGGRLGLAWDGVGGS
uniref:Uncharacterized protein n=1 Tax=Avena sativa TaxID=4498 RepID=A0ACD5TDY5_AVESA